tara:strand:- start:4195 stop:4446 length:252 start_codon:yes stop_codon:yes gene_type:complete
MVYKTALYALLLTGCASAPPVIVGHCYVPENLNYVAQGPAELPMVETPLYPNHINDDIKQRGEHGKLAKDYNTFLEYVKSECQ